MRKIFFKFKSFGSDGFTLIETVTSLGIFGVVMVVASALFISGIVLQRRAGNVQQVQENASFILETITKEIRVADLLTTDTADCVNAPSPTLHFTFQDSDGNNHNVQYSKVNSDLTKSDTVMASTSTSFINTSTIQFTNLGFCVAGQASGDSRQPRVTIFATIKSTNADQQAAMDIQVTTSQRLLSP